MGEDKNTHCCSINQIYDKRQLLPPTITVFSILLLTPSDGLNGDCSPNHNKYKLGLP